MFSYLFSKRLFSNKAIGHKSDSGNQQIRV